MNCLRLGLLLAVLNVTVACTSDGSGATTSYVGPTEALPLVSDARWTPVP